MKKASIATLSSGAAIERIDDALSEAIANIQDPNTEAKVARTVTFTLTIKPNTEREMGIVTMATKVKLAPAKEVGATVFMGFDNKGKPYAYENDPHQPPLFEEDEDEHQPAIITQLREVSR